MPPGEPHGSTKLLYHRSRTPCWRRRSVYCNCATVSTSIFVFFGICKSCKRERFDLKIQTISVRSSTGSYSVLYSKGLLQRLPRHITPLKPSNIYILSSPTVWRNWGRYVARGCRESRGHKNTVFTVLFDDRERSKNLETVEHICRQLVRAGADRQAMLVAVGGGVVGDVAGYVAASFLRGVQLVHVPTTLVAQVDSSIGGKTGVNLPEGKNLVGAFYPPRIVLADPDTLRTLPRREYRSGIYEVIKYGIIGDPQLFRFLERQLAGVLRRDSSALDYAIPRCIKAKADIVGRDERESGLRETLNFGHTLGHALETVTRYRVFRHGEAVAWGMIGVALLGVAIGKTTPSDAKKMINLIAQAGPLPALPTTTVESILAAMRADKKARGGRLRFVVATKIGRTKTVTGIPERVLGEVLGELRGLVVPKN